MLNQYKSLIQNICLDKLLLYAQLVFKNKFELFNINRGSWGKLLDCQQDSNIRLELKKYSYTQHLNDKPIGMLMVLCALMGRMLSDLCAETFSCNANSWGGCRLTPANEGPRGSCCTCLSAKHLRNFEIWLHHWKVHPFFHEVQSSNLKLLYYGNFGGVFSSCQPCAVLLWSRPRSMAEMVQILTSKFYSANKSLRNLD